MMSFEKTTASQTILCSMMVPHTVMRCHEFCHVLQVAVSLTTFYHLWFSDSEQFPLFRQILVLSVFMPLWPGPQHKKRFGIHWAPQPSLHTLLPSTICKWAVVSLNPPGSPLLKTKGARPRGWWAWPGLWRQPILTASRWPPSVLLACLPWRADPAVCWRGCRRLPGSGWTGSGWPQLLRCGCLHCAGRSRRSWHALGSVCGRLHSAAGGEISLDWKNASLLKRDLISNCTNMDLLIK